ncbi:OmpH family outer membrane protein [Chryseobacterium salipaludis]|uniref:OmpH family outer membrane protein n=1 Tax=Chryseobacterium TaxID=59732 RepID=UPI001FF6B0B0|nr:MULTISPECIES: OmpH family outer membrane protein [Chryseobacterium]MCJ8497616.1 OmpH family outer membrane protein [Chryseobacterium salipaludis]MCX3296025.1 OmpH family outer membrane protein [Planobacterium sp. JC490]
MKKIQFFFLMLLASLSLSAQKIGVVDTDYILNKMPQYKEAEARLNNQITGWQNEIQALQSEYDKKKSTLENERVLLVGDQLKQREKEVDDLDKRIKAMLNNRFGTLGEVNNARSNLTKPFQDQIWNAIRTVSEKNSLGIILDKSNNISVIFLDKRYDYTDKVLDLLLKNAPARTGAAAENQQIRDDKMRIMQAEQGKGNAQQSQQSRRKK